MRLVPPPLALTPYPLALYYNPMTASKGKVLVAMSGGVDSAVAAALLQDDGHEVVGCFMRLGSPGEALDEPTVPDADDGAVRIAHQGCCSINDAKDAQLVAAQLGIPLYVFNFKRDFGRIIDYFVAEYNAGRTPNPCVRCNDWLKFGKLADYARSIDAEHVATGHYARIELVDGKPTLWRGVDEAKDQSYVLFGMRPDQLDCMMLPIGRYTKQEIRAIAAERGLPVATKPDSQEICFVPNMDYSAVIRQRTPGEVQPGAIRDLTGQVVGEHEGHQHFTIGQRRGVGVATGSPVYVVNKDAGANTITIGPRQSLECQSLVADQVNWFIDPPRDEPMRCTVKIRYNAVPVPATVQATGPDELTVRFESAQSAAAPGQAAVCYEGDRVIGGAWIRRAD